jgi:hypothetical protein
MGMSLAGIDLIDVTGGRDGESVAFLPHRQVLTGL